VRCLLSTGEAALRSYMIFGLFFINVANDIVKGIIFDENNHPSIDRIRRKAPKNNIDFDFKPTQYNNALISYFL
jgi:preprotein translocase subunit SecB